MNDTESPAIPQRLASVDAYRGFVMFLMMAEVLHLAGVASAHKEEIWRFLAHHQEHVEWVGCSLHDLIQPSFSFLVGVALPFSIANRERRGQSAGRMTLHAFWRAFLLVFLGVFLRSQGRSITNFTFEDTLSQIGLGYGFLFMLGFMSIRAQLIALLFILIGYWGAFAAYTPGAGFDYANVGVPKDWHHLATGFAGHWNKNGNLAWAFDTWFLNLFPREKPFLFNAGGYATLSFIPTLGTMILGLLAGELLRSDQSSWKKILSMLLAGGVCMGAGWGLGELGVCPVVKRIWTPTWVLYSGGWCFLLLAFWYTFIDAIHFKWWAFPLIVIGMNSIAAYCMSGMIKGYVASSLKTHLPKGTFDLAGPGYESLVQGGLILLVFWLILLWMYRHKIYIRI